MNIDRRIEIERLARRIGPANCWTGTSGTMAGMLVELLAEIDKPHELLRRGPDLADLAAANDMDGL